MVTTPKESSFRERVSFSLQHLNLRKALGIKPFSGICYNKGIFFFYCFLATLMTNWAQMFTGWLCYAYVGIHQVKIWYVHVCLRLCSLWRPHWRSFCLARQLPKVYPVFNKLIIVHTFWGYCSWKKDQNLTCYYFFDIIPNCPQSFAHLSAIICEENLPKSKFFLLNFESEISSINAYNHWHTAWLTIYMVLFIVIMINSRIDRIRNYWERERERKKNQLKAHPHQHL